MSKDVVISNLEKLENLKNKISQAGAKKLHVLADFDQTLTRAYVGGKLVPSLLWILYNENYLTPDYGPKARLLHDKYYGIEIDPKVPREEKKKAMEEWWTRHFDLLIKSGLNKKEIKAVVESGKARLRKGVGEFVDFLKKQSIPLVIVSSGGLGGDAISMFLEKEGKLFDNIHIISNSFIWDKKGNATSVKQPIIHAMNKDETVVKNFPAIFKKIKNRKNVLLLGNNVEDIAMIGGFDYENLLKIGFLNEKAEENLETYKKNFDAVILNDSDMFFVNNLLKEILGYYNQK